MAWQEEAVELLRNMINDVEDVPVYSDTRLTRLLVNAAHLMQSEIKFDTYYNINVIDKTITPDPSDAFINLMVLKAACMFDQGDARLAVSRGLSISDAGSSIDLRGSMTGKLRIWELGWCKAYQEAKEEYFSGEYEFPGAAILGPFRTEDRGEPVIEFG